ncbi:MAG: RNA polymerase-binding protein DksA [Gammaproteobacteria bacterium]|nr:RNA polymerase-binding protein DksA [Gammaproteobacteria bacterium]
MNQKIEEIQLDRDAEYMGDSHKAYFRQKLQSWKQQLMEEVDRTVEHMKSDAANHADPNDRATQEEEFSLELRTRDRERKLIKKIDASLRDIENDEYGYCETCGIEIGVDRLDARPTADQCIDCKSVAELREKQGL